MVTPISQLQELIIYRKVLEDNIIRQLPTICSAAATPAEQAAWYGELIGNAEALSLQGDLIKQYLLYLLAHDKNIVSVTLQKTGGTLGESLQKAWLHDLGLLQKFFAAELPAGRQNQLIERFVPTFPPAAPSPYRLLEPGFLSVSATPEQAATLLISYYTQYGYGDMAEYAAFRWQEATGLTGIKHYDTIRLADIVGYDRQKTTLVNNTQAFLTGRPANHVLLSGARGTGKSSSVKALANEYFANGLRLVEVAKSQLTSLPKLMELLRGYRQRFIIFLDDLSFEEFEVEYKYLKSVIEGGLEAKPDNVLIYVTSNRRHLIKETWSDRSENMDELHRADTVNEKISLSDRFGIILSFVAPSQQEYLTIVSELARKQGVQLPPDELRTAALQWEFSHSGRSGRTAQQFINHLLSNRAAK